MSRKGVSGDFRPFLPTEPTSVAAAAALVLRQAQTVVLASADPGREVAQVAPPLGS
jgi:hypothetical protein